MNSATYFGNTEASSTAGFFPAPPPPPPPPVPGQVPAMRIRSTVETPISKRPVSSGNDPYEPPAAIQNAMMTKDKKPFTYTPGMGGKLDLSQIRSPRMARRVAKNANDEGIEGPPKSPLASEQGPRVVSTGAGVFLQPQVAVPVFPTNIVPVPQVNRPHQTNRLQISLPDKTHETPRSIVKIETKLPQQSDAPETPTTPPQVNLTRAPTPWLQNKTKPQEELPEWAKRNTTNGSSSYSPPHSPIVPIKTGQHLQQRSLQQVRPPQTPNQQERLIPLHVEDRPSVFSAKNDPGAPGHHQLKQTPPHHQSRWLPGQQSITNSSRCMPQSGGTYNVPITIESTPEIKSTVVTNSSHQPQSRNEFDQSTSSQVRANVLHQKTPVAAQLEPGPVQSRSFRVLQKITDTDDEDIDPDQLRKLQLTEDDKILMNKFKEQVDGDTYLHQEEDPRYRGATIPSRAFRYLQNITDSGDPVINTNVPRTINNAIKKQNRNSRTFDESQANLPPSEQQVQEPKKYTGSAIPSRSFKILQSMTSPESGEISQSSKNWIGTDECSSIHHGNSILQRPKDGDILNKFVSPIDGKDENLRADSAKAIDDMDDNSMDDDNTDSPEGDTNSNGTSPSSALSTAESCRIDDNGDNIDSLSSESDSDSYLAYSTGLDSQKMSNNSEINKSSEIDNKDIMIKVKRDEKWKEMRKTFNGNNDEKSNIIDQIERENISDNERNGLFNESDEVSTTVCVSLPSRLKRLSDSKRRENECRSEMFGDGTLVKCKEMSKMNSSSQSVDSSTSVEFTLRRNGSARPKSWCPEKCIDEFWTSETIVRKTAVSPVFFNLRNPVDDNDVKQSREEENKKINIATVPQFEITVDDDEKDEPVEEEMDCETKNQKILLSVQNLRTDETDDEDSGVTSDMSRIISEVDSDSESTPIQRKVSSYKRTQTHSRLFRLLSGDSLLPEKTAKARQGSANRKKSQYVSQINSNGFNYDNSNDSSGLTSPDFSPIFETSWNKFKEPATSKRPDSTGRDIYFRTWKNKKNHNHQDQEFSTSIPPRISQNGITAWTYKSNVSCPRIRSTKSVPRVLQNTIS